MLRHFSDAWANRIVERMKNIEKKFQALGFARGSRVPYPDQLVVGNSGVALAHNHPAKPFSFPIDGLYGTGFGLSEFGYMKLEPSKKHGWKGALRDPSGKKL